MLKPPAPPQLYAIRATAAPVAVVFAHRGRWFLVARWDLTSNTVEPGAWFRGRIFQRRADISPDGKLLYYFAMKGGHPFHAVSRVPWLTALALWHGDTTYGNGSHFAPARNRAPQWLPHEGSIEPLAKKYRYELVHNDSVAYGAERRRGWREHPDAVPRPRSDVYHEKTPNWLVCDQPGGASRLELRDQGYVSGRIEGRAPRYTLDGEPLDNVTWADWDQRGRLLVATREACLEIRSTTNRVTGSRSLADFVPDPDPPPGHARSW
ncbi:MAG: hypothetical protein M3680_21310 [Myxococcota bacterium]|nr:hypothetical protein [Myxococcota bacterium]